MGRRDHGGDIYRNKNAIDFSSNCNPYGPPMEVTDAIIGAAAKVGNYPDPLCTELREAIAGRFGLPDECVFAGNGAAEIIYAIFAGLKPRRVLIPLPAFSEYEEAAIQAGSKVIRYYTKQEENFEIGEDFVELIDDDIDMVFLCNPGNPTGTVTERALMDRIAERCGETGATLVVDECFLPFSERHDELTMVRDIPYNDALIVIRAFTKLYAMAGVRLGACLCSDYHVVKKLEMSVQPWNVSLIAQEAGLAALKAEDFKEKTVSLIRNEKKQLQSSLEKVGLKTFPSEGNYLFFRGPAGLYDKLLEEGILIRDCSNYAGLEEGYYRVAVKRHEDNRVLISALERIL